MMPDEGHGSKDREDDGTPYEGISLLIVNPPCSGEKLTDEGSMNREVPQLNTKDTGYSWVVLAAMFVTNILTTGYIKSFGIISAAVFDAYPEASGTLAGLMVGLVSGCRSLLAPFAGAVANKIGIRSSMCLGTTLNCIGFLASYFCTSVEQLAITLGAVIGLSHCLIDSCQVIIISQFFESKFSIANGIRTAGHPSGGILYPFLMTALLQYFGLKLTFIMLAGVTAHLFLCSFIIRPIELHTRIKALELTNNLKKQNDALLGTLTPYSNPNKENESSTSSNIKKKEIYELVLKENSFIMTQKRRKPLEFSFFKNPKYLPFILMAMAIPMGLPLVIYYMTFYAKNVVGLNLYQVSIILSFQSVFDVFLRIFIGWLNNKNFCNPSYVFITCSTALELAVPFYHDDWPIRSLWCSGVASMMIPAARGLVSLMFTVALYSLGPASFHAIINVILCDQFGKEFISTSWGFVRMTQGIFSFIHPALIGYIFDKTGTYTVPFLTMGFGMVFCGFAMVLQTILSYTMKAKKKQVMNYS